ncbi:DUF1289 domain-containing protein [Methylomonas methanica]|uniref:DUF1289 domain-containing protein n=1 Tax=Methylomonas methanica TaxID=421 RepID=A0A177LV51_METMH|nr:DUF1289 domain-containing protein [Methylomonas methanica]OAH96418.1 hypothetical protein A1332_22645 [Methylomonas methanica]
MINSESNPTSPCVRNCCLNDDDICLGCFRSLDEIRLWSSADAQTRNVILQRVAERRIDSLKTRRLGPFYSEQLPGI